MHSQFDIRALDSFNIDIIVDVDFESWWNDRVDMGVVGAYEKRIVPSDRNGSFESRSEKFRKTFVIVRRSVYCKYSLMRKQQSHSVVKSGVFDETWGVENGGPDVAAYEIVLLIHGR